MKEAVHSLSGTRQHEKEVRFSRGAWLVLAFALGLVLLSIIQLAYRYTLPTDGWAVYTTEIDQADWVYWSNLVGTPSPLQPNDVLLALEGQSMRGGTTLGSLTPPANWVAGGNVRMTILRGENELSFLVPVVNWTPAALWLYNIADIARLIDLLGALTLFAVGLFTLIKRPGLPSARALLVLCATFFAASLSHALPDGLSVLLNVTALMATSFFSYIIFGTLLAPSILTFTLLFPHPKRVIERYPWLGLLPYGLGLVTLVALASGASGAIGWFGTLGMLLASIVSLVHAGFTQRDAVSRAQLRWAIGGFAAGLALALMTFPVAFGWVTDPFLAQLMGSGVSIGFAVIGVSLAVAVLRYRLFDIDVIIRRTLVYTALTAMLALVYFGMVITLEGILRALVGEGGQIATVISTLAIAALFTPLRRRVQEVIDRRFYRQKYNAEQALAGFTIAARNETDLEALTAQVVGIVQETVQPELVSLWLKK